MRPTTILVTVSSLVLFVSGAASAQPAETGCPADEGSAASTLASDLSTLSAPRIDAISDPTGKRYARLIDTNKDGVLSDPELDAAVRRPDAMKSRLLEKAYGDVAASLKSGADLAKLLAGTGTAAGSVLAGPAPDYAKLFDGPASGWVVAFGGDDHAASSEIAPIDVSQYRGFKTFLERQGFEAGARPAGMDETGFAVYSKTVKAPDGHDHRLTVKVFNSSQFEGA